MPEQITTERRIMRRTSAWTYRCPARHHVMITVRGADEPVPYRNVFVEDHAACEASRAAKTPCPEGFHWNGQSCTACDKCGLPAWEHDGIAELPQRLASPFDPSTLWVLRPWKPGQRDAVRRKWDPDYEGTPDGQATDV